jgi:hypothetical protein
MRVKGFEGSSPQFTLAVLLVYGFSDLKRKQVLDDLSAHIAI